MEVSHEKSTYIRVGYSTLSDAFQAGREAAQMAKGHLLEGQTHLALAVGPSDVHFKDFIEGVRLVVGESALVGVPAPWVFTSEAPNLRSRSVLLIQSEVQRLTIVSSEEQEGPLVAATSLFTELRARRGNARLDFDFHGLIALNGGPKAQRDFLAHHLAADAGLESWIMGFSAWSTPAAQLISGPQIIGAGIAAVECLSNGPWGVGWVDTSAFPAELEVRREAGRSSMREALAQVHTRKPLAALLLVATDKEPMPEADAANLFTSSAAVIPGVPLIGFPVRAPFHRGCGQTMTVADEGVVSLLVSE